MDEGMMTSKTEKRPGVVAGVLVAIIGAVCCNSAIAEGWAAQTGEDLYKRFCASCHGTGGHGDGPVSKSFPTSIPDLTKIAARSDGTFPTQRVHEFIDGRRFVVAHGTRDMPVWGMAFWLEVGADPKANETVNTIIDRLVSYIESIQREPE